MTGAVTSPTYTIGHRYHGDGVEVSHLDLYRFQGVSPAEWGDLEPYFEGAIAFVEWPEAGEGVLPGAALRGSFAACWRTADHVRDRRVLSGLRVLTLAFDTATSVATRALVDDGEVLGERVSRGARRCSRTSTRCCARPARSPADLDGLAVGLGPGQLHRRRASGSRPRAGSRSRSTFPVAGVSTLARARRGSARRAAGRRRAPARGLHAASTASRACCAPAGARTRRRHGLRRRRRRSLSRAARGERRRRPARRRRAAPAACALPRGARRRASARRTRSSRSTCACRTPTAQRA